jgi:hypothetical protein
MERVPAPREPLPGRSCGGCTLCCKVMGVRELNKARGTWCVHCKPGTGCGIYAERPEACRTFLCGWLTNPRFGPEWKPDRSKMVIVVSPDGNGLDFQCDPGVPEAWRKEPYFGEIRRLAAIAAKHEGMITVVAGRNVLVVSVEGEFALGQVGETDEIMRDYTGDRLTAVRVKRADSVEECAFRPFA